MNAKIIVACAALIGVGLANVDVKPTPPTRTIVVHEKPSTRVIERVKTKLKVIRERGAQPSGYVSRDECDAIKKGTTFRDVLFRYGWPRGSSMDDSYAGFLMYPLADNHDKLCSIDFFNNRVDNVSVDL